jgi:nitrate/nitrite transporter NarK
MIVVLFQPFQDAGMAPDTAWRVAMIVPGTCFLITAICLKLLCWDTPTRKRFNVADTGKTTGASMWDYVEVLKDPRVVIMIFQYGACFGTELAMNNQLATHFRTYFQMKAGDSAVLAASFGGMNLFARSLGGITSDFLFTKFGFRGRIWAQFVGLFLEAIFLFAFGCVNNEQPWYVALGVLIVFSIFTQMSEGTSYGIVPFMNKKQLAVVSAVVGAGGNLGAVIAGFCIYKPIDDELLPFRVHAGYVMFWCLLCPFYYWPEYGGMFCGPAAIAAEDSAEAAKSSSESKQAEPVEPPAQEQAKADDGAKADLEPEVLFAV